MQRGRTLFWVLAAGLVALLLATLGQLPPVVASHFNGAGVPSGWSSRPAYALLLIVVGALLPLGTIGLVNALTRTGHGRLSTVAALLAIGAWIAGWYWLLRRPAGTPHA